MGRKLATPNPKSARRSMHVQARRASRRHPMITRSKTPRTSGTDAISAPLSSISAVDSTFTSLFGSMASATTSRNNTPNSALPSSVSATSAAAMDFASSVDIDPIVDPPSGSTTSSSFIASAIPASLKVLSDDDCDDNFHGEVETYLDYTSDILQAQAEEVKLLRREVASAREEKDALKTQHEADVTARKEEYRCPICFELLWGPYVQVPMMFT
ncbi:hypothetical protein C8J55DRAFT_566606 [Lentinula edodes]|uniref:Uncharacterized protein n=1 Tax=Lentinula lateritia TaxID=40482 RepID=A0A9W8ZRD4_9AGAR|nr:hypothetical protein C8J55DRAFT_566606 [Lentinula edodes]